MSTWTAPGVAAPWPSLLLSEDIPEARISAFGYDADVVNLLRPAGQNRIRYHARSLLKGIADMWLDTGIVCFWERRNGAQLICFRKSYQYFLSRTVWEGWSAKT